MANQNSVTEFVLLGLTENPRMQKIKFAVFLLIYIISMAGNVLILLTIIVSPLWNFPMYFFLAHLSFIDACYSSVNNPKQIANSLHEKNTRPFNACMTQIFAEHLFGAVEVILLTVMAYDHYVAICKPLHYAAIMNWRLCNLLVAVAWVGGILHGAIQMFFILPLPFCGSNVIDHYSCDLNPLLHLTCIDTHTLGFFVAANSGFMCLLNFLLLLGSYAFIIFSLKTQSSEGRQKALSTCVSHITVIVLFFLPCMLVYLRPPVNLPIDKAFTIFYTMITPMLNPLIYSFRNAQIKHAIRSSFTRKVLTGTK